MFVMQKQFIDSYEFTSLQTKRPNNTGAREFKKLISFPKIHNRWLFLQRAPFLFNSIFFKMQKLKKTKPSKEMLAEIKAELQTLNPELKRLKVKCLYANGRVTAHASIGTRRINVKSNLSNIIDKFVHQYNERYPTAFLNLNSI